MTGYEPLGESERETTGYEPNILKLRERDNKLRALRDRPRGAGAFSSFELRETAGYETFRDKSRQQVTGPERETTGYEP